MNWKIAALTGGLIVATAISFKLSERKPEKELRDAPVTESEARNRLIAWRKSVGKPLPEEVVQKPVPSPVPVPVEVNDSLWNDPVWRLARIKELKIARYHESPAKDTAECRAVVALLAKDGLGLDAVGDAYNIAWESQRAARFSQGMTPEETEVNYRVLVGRWIEKFQEQFPSVREETLTELQKIKPVVFFGNPILNDGPTAWPRPTDSANQP